MDRAQSHTPTVSTTFVLVFFILTTLFVATSSAYLFGPGKYCEVVVFDRWAACYLVSGPYITYIASDVKSELLRYKLRHSS
jgi:hypothetical protein